MTKLPGHICVITLEPSDDPCWRRLASFELFHDDAHRVPCTCFDTDVLCSICESNSVEVIAADHAGNPANMITVPVAILHDADTGSWSVREEYGGTHA